MNHSLLSTRHLFAIIFLCVFAIDSFSQEHYVQDALLFAPSGNEGKTYHYTGTVTLTDGFSVTGANGGFTIKPIITNPPPSPNENYVRVEIPKVPVGSEETLSLMGPDEKSVSYTYSDGLGRTLMTNSSQAGPSYEDVIQPDYYSSNTGRQDKSYLAFTSNSTNSGEFINNAYSSTSGYYQNPPNGVAQDLFPFAEVELEDSPQSIATSQMGVGGDWRNIEFPENNSDYDVDYFLNDASTLIPNWKLDGNGNPVRIGEHSAYTLHIVETTNEDKIKTQSISDSRGRNIATRAWYDDSGTPRWITTYYIYDTFNRLRWILPPAISTKSPVTSTELENLAFQYKYDYRGRLNYEKNPGIVGEISIYDNRNRLVYSQNGEQRLINQWTFRKYDRYNRLVMTGLYTSSKSQSTLENEVWNATGTELYETELVSNSNGYTQNNSYPKNDFTVQTITYYDNYNFKSNSNWDFELSANAFDFQQNINGLTLPANLGSGVGETTLGLVTGSKVRNLENNKWLNTVVYYDEEYRTIQVISENHLAGYDRISNQLNGYSGILEKMKVEHVGDESVNILNEYIYDHEFRLLKTYQQINSDPKVLVADYQYNALGQLIEKNLHSTDNGGSYLQSVDYRYNIRGWLSSINNDRLSESESKAQPDIFGANLYYASPPSVNGSRENRYDGRIAVFSWDADNLQGEEFNRPATEYIYDDLGRLDETDYGADGVWVNGAPNEDHYEINVGYDDQGNIKSMERKSEGTIVDNLTYSYQDSDTSNKLQKVVDNSGESEGFNDRIPGSMTDEYEYDNNGNLTRDQHKAMSIEYNYLELPSAVIFDDGRRIDYVYDATGNRLSKTITYSDSKVESRDYVGLVEYLNGEIHQLSTGEGRAFKQNEQYFYEYYITDHQGNNRIAFGILPERNVYKANMEQGVADGEFAFPSSDPRLEGENRTSGGLKSTHLNNAQNRTLGPAKVLDIKNTDVVEIEFWAKYESATSPNGTFGDLITTLLTTYGVTSNDGASGEALSNTVGSGGSNPFIPSSTSNPDDEPDAYLAYLFFDENYNFEPSLSNFVKVETESLGSYVRYSSPKLTFNENGYLFVYLANETQEDQEVFFDDLKIIHESPTAEFKVSQINEYYPFGMLTKNSWRNPGYEDPGMLYQSYYATYDSLTEYNDFILRNYDPAIGRWMQRDPYGQFASPYLAMGNNPHMGIDEDGGWWHILAAFYAGGSISAYERGESQWYNPLEWSKRDFAWAAGAAFFISLFEITPEHGVPVGGQGYGSLGTRYELGFSDFANMLADIPSDIASMISVPEIDISNFSISKDLADDVSKAMDYLSTSKRARRQINYVNRKGGVSIRRSMVINQYRNSNNTIHWNPFKGLKFKRGYGAHSPSMVLMHEISHAYKYKKRPNKSRRQPSLKWSDVDEKGFDDYYLDPHEKFAVQNSNRIAGDLGEGLRSGYKDGERVLTDGVDSTGGDEKLIRKRINDYRNERLKRMRRIRELNKQIRAIIIH